MLLYLLAAGLVSMPIIAQPTPVSLADYAEILEQVAAELRDPALSSAEIEAVLRPVQEIETVELADGELLTVDPAVFVVDDPAASDPEQVEPSDMAARLDILRAELLAAPQDQTEAYLDRLVDVFAQPAFTAQDTLADRIWRWLEQRFYEWFPDWEPTGARIPVELTTWIGWIVVGLGALVLAILGSYWLQGIFANFLGGSEGARREIPQDVPPSAAAARRQAEAAADTGDYRQAVRRLYLAALLHLDEQRLLAFDRSYTNREVLAALPGDSPVIEHLRPVVDTFDAVWYGVREPDEPTYVRYRTEIDALERMAQAAAQASAAGSNRPAEAGGEAFS